MALKNEPLDQVVTAICAIAKTLAILHEQSIWHRDVKPNNLYRYADQWVLGDLGLIDFPDKESITETGERVGPWHYFAPEMLHEAKRADGAKADVYSLAKTLWVLATGQRFPPPGEQRCDNAQICVSDYVIHPKSRPLDLLIERATRIAPEARPTMASFAKELHGWLTPQEIQPMVDVSTLVERLRLLTAPSVRVHDDRLEQIRDVGERIQSRLHQLIAPIAKRFAETGLSDGSIQQEGVDKQFRRQIVMAIPVRFWQNGVRTSARNPGQGTSWSLSWNEISLTCAAGIDLRIDRTTFLQGGFVISSNYGPEIFSRTESVEPTGSVALDEAVTALFNGLYSSLAAALERFSRWIENDGKPPNR